MPIPAKTITRTGPFATRHPLRHLFTATGKLLCAGLVAYSSLTIEQAAARGRHYRQHARHHAYRHHAHGDVAASSQDPLFCAASKAEAEATPIVDRAVTVQVLKNRATRAHRTICEVSRHGFAPGQMPSATAWEAAKNVLNGEGDLVPAAFKQVTEFRSPTCGCPPRGFRRIGSVVRNGNIYYTQL